MRKKSESSYLPKKNFVDPSALKIEDMLREIEKIRDK